MHIHRQSDHAEVVLQEVFARRVIGLIRYKANGLSELAHELVGLAERDAGKAGHRGRGDALALDVKRSRHLIVAEAVATGILPRGTHLRGDLHVVELHVVPEDDLWRLREHCQVQLLGIAVHAHVDATCVDPSTAVFPWGDVVEVAHHVIAQVVLQVLCRGGVAGLRARPDAVEVCRLLLEVEAQTVEMVVPVGIFDDDLYLRIHLLGGFHHELPAGVGHQPEAVLRPALRALGGNLVIVLQVDEEEVVEDKVIEELRRILSHLFHNLTFVRSGVAVSLEVGRLAAGVGDAAAHLEAL